MKEQIERSDLEELIVNGEHDDCDCEDCDDDDYDGDDF